jgi:hypothetical protein
MNDDQRRPAARGYENRVILITGQMRRCGMALSVLLFIEFGPGWPELLSVSCPVVRVQVYCMSCGSLRRTCVVRADCPLLVS